MRVKSHAEAKPMLTRGSDQRELFKRTGDKDNQKIMSFWLWHVNFSPFQVPPGLFLSSFAWTEALFSGWVGPRLRVRWEGRAGWTDQGGPRHGVIRVSQSLVGSFTPRTTMTIPHLHPSLRLPPEESAPFQAYCRLGVHHQAS